MSGYRGIEPKLTFEGDSHPLNRSMYLWVDDNNVVTGTFAGQEMMICLNDDGQTYELTYLNMAHPQSFKSVKEAKDVAVDFARAVLLKMFSYVGVGKDDLSLQQCLLRHGQ